MPSTPRSPASSESWELAIPPGLSPAQRLAWATKAKRLSDLRAKAEARRSAALDPFEVLGFEPICKPRVLAQNTNAAHPDRAPVPVPDPCGTCPQEEFFASDEWDVFYGGAAGGSKTVGLLMYGIRACWDNPRLEVWAFRETYPELRGSFLKELLNKTANCVALGARWNETNRELRFPNKSLLRFCYADTEADAADFYSQECQLLLIDERTKMLPQIVDRLTSRIRTGSATVPVIGVRSASNPGGIGHADVKTRYVDPQRPHEAMTVTVEVDGRSITRTRRFIPARVDDNPHLGAEYADTLSLITDPHLRRAMRDGNWDTFGGQFFGEWNRDRHVIAAFAPPPTWRKVAGIDHGYAKPWAVEWVAYDGDGRAWVYRERYAAEVGEGEQARAILDAEGSLTPDGKLALQRGERVRRFADPSMWAKKSESNPIATTYVAAGCLIVPATNARVIGWTRVHSYLAEGPACDVHRAMGWSTCPLLHVMDCCPDLIRTLPALPRDDKKPEDVDTDAEDHAPDALRYALMSLPVPRIARETAQQPQTFDERMWALKAKRDRDRRRGTKTHDVLGAL